MKTPDDVQLAACSGRPTPSRSWDSAPDRSDRAIPWHVISKRAGYRIVPVRPDGPGPILGEPVSPNLRAAAATADPIDIVDIFRRSEAIPALVGDILAIRPRLVWMQVGVVHAASAERLEDAGIPVVMDRCLAVAHQQLIGGPTAAPTGD